MVSVAELDIIEGGSYWAWRGSASVIVFLVIHVKDRTRTVKYVGMLLNLFDISSRS